MKRPFFGLGAITIRSFIGAAAVFAVLFLVSANNADAQSDTAPPQLVNFDFSPRTINTSYSQAVTVTLRVTDNLSGFQSGGGTFKHSLGPYTAAFSFNSINRISGDARDGVYQTTMFVTSTQSAVGTWNLINLSLTDNSGNTKNYSQSELSGLGFPTTLEVTHNIDVNPPVLQSFSFSPGSINTGGAAQTVTVTARITDDVSGFNQAGGVRFQSPSGQQFAFKSFNDSRISGDARDGIYQIGIEFPQNSEPGVWRVVSVSITDFETNNRFYSTSQLTALGFPTDLQVASTPATVSNRRQFDFDGDGRADVSVFNPTTGVWHILNSSAGYREQQFAVGGDRLAPADYDNDGKTDIAIYRPSNKYWYLLGSSWGYVTFQFGNSEDLPVTGDYDGDGKTDAALYRPSNRIWYLSRSSGGYGEQQFGEPGDKPVPADYDGDGKTDIAVYRPSNGVWYILRSSLGYVEFQFGGGNYKPVVADYDGDGKADVAVYLPSSGVWYLSRSSLGYKEQQFGGSNYQPVPADYDGDGKTDIAVYLPSNGVWYLLRSSGGYTEQQFGGSGFIPVVSAYLP